MGKSCDLLADVTLLHDTSDTKSVLVEALCQLRQQRLGLLQVLRVKPFSEPAVDLGQQLVGFDRLALLLPQSRQAHHRSQLNSFAPC